MKVNSTLGKQTLSLNPNEVLDRSTVVEAFINFGASRRLANQLADEFFCAVATLLRKKLELRQKRREQGRRMGQARAEQLRQQRKSQE